MTVLRTRPGTPPDVLPMKEARRILPKTSRAFLAEGVNAEPVFFGAHRRPAGVMLSYERYVQILDLLDDLSAAAEIRKRDGADTGERASLEDLIRDQGFDLAEFGLDE